MDGSVNGSACMDRERARGNNIECGEPRNLRIQSEHIQRPTSQSRKIKYSTSEVAVGRGIDIGAELE